MKKIKLADNEEIRTELVRLYLDQEHPAILAQLQEEVRQVTNHIVRSRRDVKEAAIAYCRRHGLVGDSPVFPHRPSYSTPHTDEEKKQVKETWKSFKLEQKKAAQKYTLWLDEVFAIAKGVPVLHWRQESYKSLRKIYGRIGSAVLFRDTVNRVMATKWAKHKKKGDHIPLVFANTPVIQTGSFWGNRRGIPFYNALIKLPIKPGNGRLMIKGRLRRPLPGKPIQGVSLFKEPDGWYAAIKCVVQKRQIREPSLSPIGVDVGQTDLVAMSDGYKELNPRNSKFIKKKSRIQRKGDLSANMNYMKDCWNRVGRLDQKYKRKISHWINSYLLPKLENHSLVFVEDLTKGFKFNHGPVSCMHSILRRIKIRLGERVCEVDRRYTSQTCSCCGNSTEIVRQGKYFSCLNPNCMATLDADVNAARNILARGLELLACEA